MVWPVTDELHQLQDNEDLARTVFDCIGDGLVISDSSGNIFEANKSFRAMVGVTAEKLDGRSIHDFVSDLDSETVDDAIQAVGPGAPVYAEAVLNRIDGSHCAVGITIAQVGNRDSLLVFDFHDISELKWLNQELEEARARMAAIIRSSPYAIVAFDSADNVVYVNHAAESLIGWENDDGEHGKLRAAELFPEGEYFLIKREVGGEQQGESVARNRSMEIRTADGGRVPVLANAAGMAGSGGTEQGMVFIFLDARQEDEIRAELFAAREKLVETEREAAAASLAGTTAHHLNQPLTSVIGYLQMLQRTHPELNDDPTLAKIRESASQMADIVKEIGRITRFEERAYGATSRIFDIDPSRKKP